MDVFEGTGVALVTPFTSKGAVDYDALRKLVRYQVDNGTDFLVVQGTTGEAATLTDKEKEKVLTTVIEENAGVLKVVLGLAGNNTASTVAAFQEFDRDGVDGFLSASPHYNKPSQEGIFQHFKALSEATELPIIVYNVPGRTGSNVTAQTTLRLSALKNIVAVKEASGNLEQVMEVIQHAPKGFKVLSGEDALTMPMIAAGAHGVISVVANAFPKRFSTMVKACIEGDLKTARQEHYALLSITHLFFAEGNPSGVKASLKAQAIMQEYLRLPLTMVTDSLRYRIVEETTKLVDSF